jgi:hypothetical protein
MILKVCKGGFLNVLNATNYTASIFARASPALTTGSVGQLEIVAGRWVLKPSAVGPVPGQGPKVPSVFNGTVVGTLRLTSAWQQLKVEVQQQVLCYVMTHSLASFLTPLTGR